MHRISILQAEHFGAQEQWTIGSMCTFIGGNSLNNDHSSTCGIIGENVLTFRYYQLDKIMWTWQPCLRKSNECPKIVLKENISLKILIKLHYLELDINKLYYDYSILKMDSKGIYIV